MRVVLAGKVNLLHTNQIDVLESINSVLKKMEMDVVELDDEIVCGEASINLGLTDNAEKVFSEFKKNIHDLKADVVVSAYAAGVAKWKNDIPKLLNFELGVPYIHLTQLIAEEFEKKKPKLKPFPHTYFVQHGCTLGRKMGQYNFIREILELIPEIKVLEEVYPTAEIEGVDSAEFNSCPGSWLNFSQPELGDYVKENYVLEIVKPLNPEYAGSTCANGHLGIRQGLEIAEIDNIKPLYFTQLLESIMEV